MMSLSVCGLYLYICAAVFGTIDSIYFFDGHLDVSKKTVKGVAG